MKNVISHNHAVYSPQYYKCFAGALEAFFSQECPQMGGFRTRQMLVQSISNMVHKFYPETTNMKQGQITWTTVHKNEKCSYGKSIRNTRLTNVVLDLIHENEIMERADGKKLRDIKKEAVIRLHNQAYEQYGCLTNAESAIMLKMSPGTIGKYIKEWEISNKTVVPRRGSIHDIGPTLTHKKIIIHKLFIEQKNVQQVSRETCHSIQAIQRYISTFKQVLLCKKKNLSTEEAAFTVGKTVRLIKEYEAIIEEYKNQGYIVNDILNYEVNIESQLQRDINQMSDLQGQMPV